MAAGKGKVPAVSKNTKSVVPGKVQSGNMFAAQKTNKAAPGPMPPKLGPKAYCGGGMVKGGKGK